MSSEVASIRADDLEFAAWRGMAVRLGLSFNQWARRALNDQLELDVALLREREVSDPEAGFAPGLES